MNANPTQGQLLHVEYQKKKEELKDTTKSSILSKYGGEEYLEKAPKELLQGQTEEYVEFSRTGQVVKGKEKAAARSKYPEDGELCCILSSCLLVVDTVLIVFVNNHTAVWGSWFDPATGHWGFACCHSFTHLSYCTGLAGITASEASSAKNLLTATAAASSSMPPPPVPAHALAAPAPEISEDNKEDRKKKAEELFSKKRLGEGEVKLDERRLAEAMREERDRKRKGRTDEEDDPWGKSAGKDKKKKKKAGEEVTEEELGKCTVLFRAMRAVLTLHCRGVSNEPTYDG